MLPAPEPPDQHDRTVRVDAWINGLPKQLVAVCHPGEITLLAPGIRIEIEGGRWRLFAMRIAVRMFLRTKLTRR